MLRFFRRIRKSLIDSGSAKKYVLYASGEILLVVIGILIALQINNWNEQRKARKQEIKILLQMKADLKNNLEEITSIKNNMADRQKEIDTILIYFQTRRPVDDNLRWRLAMLQPNTIFNNANTTYKFIESSGFGVLSNDSLRVRFTEIYETAFKNIDSRQARELKVRRDVLPAYMQKYFRSYEFAISDESLPIGMRAWLNSEPKPMSDPINIEFLRSDPEFVNILNRLRAVMAHREQRLTETIEDLQILMQDLDIEIERLRSL